MKTSQLLSFVHFIFDLLFILVACYCVSHSKRLAKQIRFGFLEHHKSREEIESLTRTIDEVQEKLLPIDGKYEESLKKIDDRGIEITK